MTDRRARGPGPSGARARAQEPLIALEPARVDAGRLRVELRCADRVERLDVREFTPDWLLVEVPGGRSVAAEPTAATLELVGPEGFVEEFRCELEFAGWMAVSGRLGGDGRRGADKLGLARLRIGVERHERPELVRVYRQLRFPALVDADEFDAGELAALFERAGYRGWEPDGARPAVAGSLAAFPPELGVEVAYRAEDGAAIGHVCVTRAYSQAWLVHQLVVDDEHRRSGDCRVALYNHLATLPVLIDGHQRQYLFGYYDRSKPWHQLFFDSFVDWYDDPHNAAVVPFDRYEAIECAPPRGAEEVELDQARPAELDQAVALIREQLPGLACAAFDIDASRLDRAYLHPDYAAHGIARGRRVFVVREAGELVGLALCESCNHERNLGDLFDAAQLYFRSRATSAARAALVRFVRGHYRALGQAHPVFLARAGALDDPGQAGLALVETQGCVIWTGHSLRAYRTFLRTAFARVGERSQVGARARLDGVYLPRVAAARARLRSDPRLAPLSAGACGPAELLGFLVHLCAFGLRTGEGAEQIRRAGFASAAAGQDRLAAALAEAAQREHDRTHALLEDLFEPRWLAELDRAVDPELLLHQPPPRSLLRFIAAREAAGSDPRALLAVELELAELFASLAAIVLDACARVEPDLRPSFALAAADRAGVDRLAAALAHAIGEDPRGAAALAEAGGAALDAYVDLLGDCVELGRELAARVRTSAADSGSAAAPVIRLAFA